MDINRHWYGSSDTALVLLLSPLSWIFRGIVALRRNLYRSSILKTYHFSAPVIVVGNITVGGTGKTPFVIWLAHFLKEQGFRPGIVSRGYGGTKNRIPNFVHEGSLVSEVGDEAVLLSRRTGCPVVIGVNRVDAVKALLAKTDCDIVISDDGLQHYRLGRQLEIAIVDGVRRFGNQRFLPAGPLREPISRLAEMDFVVSQQQTLPGEYQMSLSGDYLVSVIDSSQQKPLSDFNLASVRGVAAIGDPKRFFGKLRSVGMVVTEHVFPDHYLYQKKDIDFQDALPVVMTEKDAVKCEKLADERHWYIPVKVRMDDLFKTRLLEKLSKEAVCTL
ncbi:MAG: tetraacyldisaccharide 4'-kinase [Gammaproteobacteria bacterium]|nr:tetraacyldisaccharide 4'-kinase [Gammaproteobacteria bacterium]